MEEDKYKKDSGKSVSTEELFKKCSDCGKIIKGFRDEASRNEYFVTGLCQRCQDKIYGPS